MGDNDSPRDWRGFLLGWLRAAPADRVQLIKHLQQLQKQSNFPDRRKMAMIEGVLRMGEWEVRDVMIAKNDIVGLRIGDDYQTAVATVCDKQHSRYPVFGDDRDAVHGILLAKDLLRFVDRPQSFSVKNVMRPPVFEPLTKRLDTLLDDFLRHRNHMIIAVDEYALTAGAATIEDVLERIVGEIEDEFDDDDDKTTLPTAGGDIIRGAMSVEEFNAAYEAELPEDGADTLAGWLAAEIGYIPKPGDKHRTPRFIFEVADADDRRIYAIKVIRADSQKTDS